MWYCILAKDHSYHMNKIQILYQSHDLDSKLLLKYSFCTIEPKNILNFHIHRKFEIAKLLNFNKHLESDRHPNRT